MFMIKKERLDKLLVERNLINSREKAQRAIMANLVTVNGKKITKAGTKCAIDSDLVIDAKNNERYVSRGGYKLEKALEEFDIKLENSVVLDVGASTGGFTDCLLKHGAKKVYCIDVGYGQLEWRLRNDTRIVNLEKTNIRYLDTKKVNIHFDLATIDVSFISLAKVLPVVNNFVKADGKVIALIKPQFEAGREKVRKGGIVDDPVIHREIIIELIDSVSDYQVLNITYSPIKNSPGNIEYLIHLKKNKGCKAEINPGIVENVINQAYQYFFNKDIGKN